LFLYGEFVTTAMQCSARLCHVPTDKRNHWSSFGRLVNAAWIFRLRWRTSYSVQRLGNVPPQPYVGLSVIEGKDVYGFQ